LQIFSHSPQPLYWTVKVTASRNSLKKQFLSDAVLGQRDDSRWTESYCTCIWILKAFTFVMF